MKAIITDQDLEQMHLDEDEFRLEVATRLYEIKKLSLGQAAKFARLSRYAFQKELAKRKIAVHYSVNDLHHDIGTLKSINDNK
ncbi:MAG: UPF0175 family protein [Bacteroidota bacterium]|nr:UPF0175 family protein [Bacteroidota bacterium]